jgi:hypothetical protein
MAGRRGIDPEAPGLGAATARIEHGNRCVVGEQRLRGEHMFCEPGLQRLQPPDRAANPVGERRSIQFDTVPGEERWRRREFLLPPAENAFSNAIAARHLGGPHTGARGLFQNPRLL